MRILLIQVGGKMPNFALRKYGGYFKELGHKVFYDSGCEDPDMVKISCIFKWDAQRVRDMAKRFSCPVEIGGCGVDPAAKLPDEVEHHMPDYEGMDFFMGTTARGCIRECNFCDTWRNEGPMRNHAPISEFWDGKLTKGILLDNNFVASPRWVENLEFARENRLKLCITQGIDARLVTEEVARTLREHWPLYNWHFTDSALYTAWDRMEDEEAVLMGIRNLIAAGIPARKIIPYVLVAHDTTLEQDLYRFNKLKEIGTTPFVMPYDNGPHPMRRWGNRPALYKSMPFEEWRKLRIREGRSY